jgi:hypothetical protein
VLSVLFSPALRTAAMNTESCGFAAAALIACSLLIEPMLPLPLAGIIAQSAPMRAAVAELAGLGTGVAVGVAVPVGVAVIVFELPHAVNASAVPAIAAPAIAATAAGRIRCARKPCGLMRNVVSSAIPALALRRVTFAPTAGLR